MNLKNIKNVTYLINLILLIVSGYVYAKGSHFGIGFLILLYIYFPIIVLTLIFLLLDFYIIGFNKNSKSRSNYFFVVIGVIGFIGQIVVNQIIQS
jgi:hypothetical protein